MVELTFVTAIFDIKREKNKKFSRSLEDYLMYFAFWARIKNRLVVYCPFELKEKILNIRKKFNLLNQTVIITYENLKGFDSKLYQSINNTMRNKYFKNFMLHSKNPEVISPDYNFIMTIKPLLVKNAIKKLKLEGQIAWIDFGFNHGGKFYKNSTDFDFYVKFNFTQDKIHLFNIKKLQMNLPIFEVIRRMETFIQGGMIIANYKLWPTFWNIIRNNMLTLNGLGLADDDQVLYLMAYMNNPNLVSLHYADWNEQISLYSNKKITYHNNLSKKKFISSLRKYYSYIVYSIKTLFNFF